jgi:Protein of unknown function (DUF3172)
MKRRPPPMIPPSRDNRGNDRTPDRGRDWDDYGSRDRQMDDNDYRDRKPSGPNNGNGSGGNKNSMNLAIVGAIFVLGIVLGVIFSYNVGSSTETVATEAEIARLAPNPELCAQYGASAIVTDTRVFVTLNPRRVFVSQPKNQPGCVLRSSNWSVLQQQDAINSEEIGACRNRMNTFAYTGDIKIPEKAEVDCVYQNDGQRRF